MNDTAAFIYERMTGESSVDDICEAVMDEYELGGDMREAVCVDMLNTIRDLQWQRVVELKRARGQKTRGV